MKVSLRTGDPGSLTPISPLDTALYTAVRAGKGPVGGVMSGFLLNLLRVRSLHPNLYNQRLSLSETHVLKGQNEEVVFTALASTDSVVMTAQNGPHVNRALCSQDTYGRVAFPISWEHGSLRLISCQKSYQQAAGWDTQGTNQVLYSQTL